MEEEVVKKQGKNTFIDVTRLGITLALMLAIGFAGGLTVAASGTGKAFSRIPLLGNGLDSTPDESVDLADFWRTWNALDAKFIETHASSSLPTSKEKIWHAIQGLASSYNDPYTVFLPPEEAKVFQEDIAGNFEGVGMEIGTKEGLLTVIAPLKGTPAERAGILPGDGILTIDGTSTEGLSSDEAVKLIRGEKGTSVVFRMLRDGEVIELTAIRDTIEVPTIDTSYDAQTGIYTLSLYSFTANSSKLFGTALADFRTSGANKLIIDLRGNPGGYLEASVSMAGYFLPEGSVVVTEDYKGKRENIVHRSKGKIGVPQGTEVVVLINQGSASASEILAGALQDAGIATLIGSHSFGKGSVQELVEINGGALKVTVARWLTPSGRSISDGGLKADIEVARTREDYTAGIDPQKERAIKFLMTGK